MIDVNVHLFQWPFRRLAGDTPEELVAQLQTKGVRQAWAGSFEALFCRDISAVNARLAAACNRSGSGFLVPFGCVNLTLPDWKEELRRCQEVHRMPGIRLYPNYHRYSLADARAEELLSLAASRAMVVQIDLCMEDPRTQIEWLMVLPVDPRPLASIVSKQSALKLVLLCGANLSTETSAEIDALRRAPNVYFDIARNEGVGGLEALMTATSPERVLFGSHFPFFYFESSFLKVKEADLSASQRMALIEDNAKRLLQQV